MGLLDDLLGKDAIKQLTIQLSNKIEEVARAESNIVELKLKLTELEKKFSTNLKNTLHKESEISQLKVYLTALKKQIDATESQIVDRDVVINSLKLALNEQQSESISKKSELEKLRAEALIQKVQTENIISSLKVSIDEANAKALAAATAKASIERELRTAQETHDFNEKIYKEREVNFTEKSEKLLGDQQKFQQQAADLFSREQQWKNIIEPQLKNYEAHLSIDHREQELEEKKSQLEELQASLMLRDSDLTRRSCTDQLLIARESEISEWEKLLINEKNEQAIKAKELIALQSLQEAKRLQLNDFEQSLIASQEVFDKSKNQLYVDKEKLTQYQKEVEVREKSNRSLYAKQIELIRKQDAALIVREKNIKPTEASLKIREKIIKQDELAIILTKQKNIELQKEKKQLVLLKESLEVLNSKSLLQLRKLVEKHELLQSNYAKIDKKLKSTLINFATKSSFNNIKVISWLIESGDYESTDIKNGWLASTGNGPWHDNIFNACLAEIGYGFFPIPDNELKYIIVGRQGWSKTDLIAQIEMCEGQSLRIYSQEMFFSKLLTGRDPFDTGDDELLAAFAKDHPALQFLISLPEPWPTYTRNESENISYVDIKDFGVMESPLHILGYRVGHTSDLSVVSRRMILTNCFLSRVLTFSEDSNKAYINKWGKGGGAQRLYRIAVHIRSLADGRNGKDPRKPQAREDWVSDLKWLKNEYYANYKNRFSWPGALKYKKSE